MKNTGICIKCNSSEVYTDNNLTSRGDRAVMANHGKGFFSSLIYVQVYLCIDCGYFEEYIGNKDLDNEKKVNNIKSNWKRMA